ncbi:MAG: ferredoxin [Spirochaetae bacterium HGW-Spirochaetae-1]|jgi:ferredoxin|nr:MAG: ferredoxin [Spirochaetae bacterium HGW-Spirochaetae-1]
MARSVFVDEKECTGCELCIDMLPVVFKMNSNGVSVAQDSSMASESEIQDVIDNCPAECIHWK